MLDMSQILSIGWKCSSEHSCPKSLPMGLIKVTVFHSELWQVLVIMGTYLGCLYFHGVTPTVLFTQDLIHKNFTQHKLLREIIRIIYYIITSSSKQRTFLLGRVHWSILQLLKPGENGNICGIPTIPPLFFSQSYLQTCAVQVSKHSFYELSFCEVPFAIVLNYKRIIFIMSFIIHSWKLFLWLHL